MNANLKVLSEPEKIAPTPIKTRVRSIMVTDCAFANAVKVGKKQINYLTSEGYDMKLTGTVLSIRKRDWKAKELTVYTTVNNMIYWR